MKYKCAKRNIWGHGDPLMPQLSKKGEVWTYRRQEAQLCLKTVAPRADPGLHAEKTQNK